jgi:ABC-type sugar transport system ATPase subunit
VNGENGDLAGLRIENLRKSFGAVDVLKGIDLDINDGEFVSFLGPSGCGKSTLLRSIAGLEDLSDGAIHLGGREITDLPSARRDIAMVFQNYALYPHMNVRKNMSFGLSLNGMKTAEIEQRVTEAAEILRITELLGRKPRQLSGGQRQRVAIGRAIVRKPQLFLLDEPLSNLDAGLRVTMRAELAALHERLGVTMVYVTHDQVEAMTMADRIVVMRAGKLEQSGKPLELYDRPLNAFVAGFIGSPAMNLMQGEASEGRVHFGEGIVFDIDNPLTGPVLYGIRPEHLDLVAPDSPGSITTTVTLIESTGTAMFVAVKSGDLTLHALFTDRPQINRGDTIHLRPRRVLSHLFDAATHLRLPQTT